MHAMQRSNGASDLNFGLSLLCKSVLLCYAELGVFSSFVTLSLRKRELVARILETVSVLWLLSTVLWVGQCVIVVFLAPRL